MKKGLAIALALCLLAAAALGGAEVAQVRFSERYHNIVRAQQALEEKYGITENMGDYFLRTVEELGDGEMRVTWEPAILDSGLPWLLGSYTAEVTPSTVTVVWTHDGESVEGGYEAMAWGAPQLTMIMEEVRTEWSFLKGLEAAENAARKAGYDPGAEYISPVESETALLADGEYAQQAMDASAFTWEELDQMARNALAVAYGELEWERLETSVGEIGGMWGMLEDRPVTVIPYDLWGQGSPEWEWSEGDGLYVVTLNVQTGEIEEILHSSELSGNG